MKKIIFVLMVISLNGCQVLGNKAIKEPENFIGLKSGETDKASVFAKFGQPGDVFDRNNSRVWRYLESDSSPEPATFILGVIIWPLVIFTQTEYDIRQSDFIFDNNGKLLDVNTKRGERRLGLFSGLSATHDAKAVEEQSISKIKAEMEEQKLPFNEKIARSTPRFLALSN